MPERSTGWRPKLVLLDLDGTVVPYDHERAIPTARVRAAVARTLAAGVPVTIATGRAVWSALPTAAALGLHGIRLVCSNGAVVYDADDHVVLHEVTFDPKPAADALSRFAAERAATSGAESGAKSGAESESTGGLAFAVERGIDGFLTTTGFERDFTSEFIGSAPLDELVSRPTTRMVCRPNFAGKQAIGPQLTDPPYGSASAIAKELADAALAEPAIASSAANTPAYTWEIGYTGWIDIVAAGVSKATGGAMLAADLGVEAADVLAIGDGSNDLAMFAWAGRSVAMAQAPDGVRAAAGAITASIDEDGVAVELERWFGVG